MIIDEQNPDRTGCIMHVMCGRRTHARTGYAISRAMPVYAPQRKHSAPGHRSGRPSTGGGRASTICARRASGPACNSAGGCPCAAARRRQDHPGPEPHHLQVVRAEAGSQLASRSQTDARHTHPEQHEGHERRDGESELVNHCVSFVARRCVFHWRVTTSGRGRTGECEPGVQFVLRDAIFLS
ncbi:hypothetical protein FA95DRAFT_1281164 [Auriscalpium vulgare]|uniref:Uncharacterized protein n=1 Tax=Auriscalpium vulgare TaxID=40419 RepID=A0ACB8RU63_9AGAM|nr:hypothetical protein FA95DRAFT_1281164 [Auriscalpium vulgare]